MQEKLFQKSSEYPFMGKALQKVSIEKTFFNIIKAIYEKSTTNINLNGEKLKAFPLRSGIRQDCPFLPLLSNRVLEVLAMVIREEKEIKRIGEELNSLCLQMT